ncbi:MAG: Rieske 2Fe-2S domain-containing protein [Xanthobacteraceae bacterium]
MDDVTKLNFTDLEAVGAGTPAGRYLRLFWHPVLRANDMRPRTAKPVEVLGEKFTLYRGEGGTFHLVAFRCPHRGAQLSLGWIEGDDIRCRYHGWRFDCSGQCVEQPNVEMSNADRVKMRTYPTREYLGLVFAYLGEGEPPPFVQYPDLDRPGVVITDATEVIPCNFWNRLDNDINHIPWVHRATALRKGRNDFIIPRGETVEETPYGWKSTRFAKGQSNGYRDMSGSAHFFMPNVYQFGVRTRVKGFEGRNLWDTKITWTVPINDKVFAAFDVTHTPLEGEEARAYTAGRLKEQEAEAEERWDLAEKVLAGEMTLEELPDDLSPYTSFAIEDYVTQVGQGPVEGRGRERLVDTDKKVILLRRLWLQEVTAMLAGKPLTRWQMPAEPLQVIVTG